MAMTNEKRLARRGFSLAYTDNYRPVYAKETHDGTVYVKLYGRGAKMTIVKSGEFASAKEAIAALEARKAKPERPFSVSTRAEERKLRQDAAITREERKLRRKEMQKQWTNDWRSRNRERLRAYYREYRLRRKAQEEAHGK